MGWLRDAIERSRWRRMNVLVAKDGSGAYVQRIPLLPGDIVARSEPVHDAVTLDFDADGNLLGVEVIASPR